MIIEIYHHDRAKELLIVTKIYIIYIYLLKHVVSIL